jgi:enoyl-CoA hydratase
MSHYTLEGDSLAVDISEGIATLTLNRPAQHNALSIELRRNLRAALTAANEDEAVGVIILTGAGEKAFSAGVDLKEMATASIGVEEMGPDSPLMSAFTTLRKPTIAAINGYAVTGGFELAVNCDILVASTNAKFADTHARVGVVSAWGLSQHLHKVIGPMRARYLSFTGNYLDAQTAKEWGLVLDVLEPAALLPFCRKMAQDILSCDPATLRDLRGAIHRGVQTTLAEGLAFENELARASLARFDKDAFAARREAVIGRGQRQSG